MGISVGGIVSGIDTEEIISALLGVEKVPVTNMESKIEAYEVELSTYGELSSLLKTLSTAASALDKSTDFNQFSATSSDTDVFTAKAYPNATAGSYSISVDQLAQAQKLKSSAFETDAPVGAGTLTLQLGAGDITEITLDEDDTLADLANKINEGQSDVRATVITNGDESYLTLVSQKTGEDNQIEILITEDADGAASDASGISRLAYSAEGTQNMAETQPAENAILTVDGVSGIERSSNTIDDLIKGVQLTLSAENADGETTTLTIGSDTSGMATKITEFVDAYNAVAEFLATAQAYDSETGEAGSLLGDNTANLIRTRLDRIMGSFVSGDTIKRLSDIGIEMNDDGMLEVDSSALGEALEENYTSVRNLFTLSGEGIGAKMKEFLDSTLNSTKGILTMRTGGIQDSIADLEEKIEAYEIRISKTEERLQKQFAALETTISQWQSMGDYLTQQFDALNSSDD
jgi:flagellar hook-associated protein 2